MPGATILVILAMLLAVNTQAATPPIEIEALFPDTAVVKIDGQRKTLKVGQTFKGVTLIAAYSETATLEYEGRQMVLGLSRRVGTNYQQPAEQTVTIRRNEHLQYRTNARINGRNVSVMVDTGANILAINMDQAKALGIDYESGRRGSVETASGQVNAWVVTLSSVDVGGIRVNQVEAAVIEGGYPSTILLGMTYLRHVKIKEDGGIMTLSRTR